MRKLHKISLNSLGKGMVVVVVIFLVTAQKFGFMWWQIGVMGCAFLVIAAVTYYRYFRIEKTIYNMENQPVVRTDAAVSSGSFAGSGKIICDAPLISPFGDRSCVYFHVVVEEERGIRNKRWVTVEDNADFVPFELEDDRGLLAVDLSYVDHDDIGEIPRKSISRVSADHPLSLLEASMVFREDGYTRQEKIIGPITSTVNCRKTEFVLYTDEVVSVFGYTSMRGGRLTLHESKDFPLVITHKSHENFLNQFQYGRGLIYVSPILGLVGATMALWSLQSYEIITPAFAMTLFFVACAMVAFVMGISVFNRIVTEYHRTDNAKGNLEGELKRRRDLITNLVPVVRQYAGHEQSVLAQVINRRLQTSEVVEPEKEGYAFTDIGAALIEDYPELKGDTVFAELAYHLSETEGRIASSRDFHNENVQSYNQYIQMFPHNLLASLAGFKAKKYFTIKEVKSQSAPEVRMS